MKSYLALVLSLLFCLSAKAQIERIKDHTNPAQQEERMQQLAHTLMKDSIKENRVKASKELNELMVQTLKSPQSFDYPFDSLHHVVILYPKDRSFRIITWQLYVDTSSYQYSGYIQMNDKAGTLHSLTDGSDQMENYDYDITGVSDWYGALYYNIHQFDTKEGRKYLLFGFDGFTFFSKRKLIDVLSFRNDRPVFGAPVFAKEMEGRPPITKNRIMLEYSVESAIRLNYDDYHKLIMMDHLIPMKNPYGSNTVMVPDGSYEGYKLKKGMWLYNAKLFNHVWEDAPRPKPVLGTKKVKKDIFGRDQK